jgi:hypothetical protein
MLAPREGKILARIFQACYECNLASKSAPVQALSWITDIVVPLQRWRAVTDSIFRALPKAGGN